jgi:hypothetical protein
MKRFRRVHNEKLQCPPVRPHVTSEKKILGNFDKTVDTLQFWLKPDSK